ncbi:MAG: ClpX C4-type zinc finger protein [Deltaproteobacteria bacterium]|nr:ClpX C4-type zinc finger protein [Deltaproteobacteria bacterium]
MGRGEIRELVRKAQAAEIAGELEQAADLLGMAGRLHLELDEGSRAATLLRHALRLRPEHAGAKALLHEAESTAHGAGGDDHASALGPLEVPHRGPSLPDTALESWCSFCCRPRAEVGPMVGGPAGAFICARCVGASADMLAVAIAVPAAEMPQLAGPPEVLRACVPSMSVSPADSFIEAAVVLSKELGWSLGDIRTLSSDEIERALRKVENLRGSASL